MGWSIPVGTVRGTVLRVHVTFLLLLVFIAFANHHRAGPQAAAQSIAFMLLLFGCVLLHELGHVAAARRYGVHTPDVTLLPIGGIARLERIPEQPRQELAIALAGPAVNLAIAALLWLVGGPPHPAALDGVTDARIDIVHRLLTANLLLAAFNLVPALPMDGGRVLRALLAARLGYVRGTQIAAAFGQAVAFLFGLYGLFGGNALLVFIALFVYLGAAAEAAAVQMRHAGRGMIAADAMLTNFLPAAPATSIEAAAEAFIRTGQHEFPVVGDGGRMLGLLTRDDIIKALRRLPPETPARDVMRAGVPTVHCRQMLEVASRLLQKRGVPAVGVVDDAGQLHGYITAEVLGALTMIAPDAVQWSRPANPWRLAGAR